MCILPHQHSRFMHFGLVGSYNRLHTFHTLINLLVTNLFDINAQHWLIGAARWDKNGVLQSKPLPWSVGCLLSDVTSGLHGSPNQPARCNQKRQSIFLNISSQADNCVASKCWRTVFGLAKKRLVKHLEGLWNFVKTLQRRIKNQLKGDNPEKKKLNRCGFVTHRQLPVYRRDSYSSTSPCANKVGRFSLELWVKPPRRKNLILPAEVGVVSTIISRFRGKKIGVS